MGSGTSVEREILEGWVSSFTTNALIVGPFEVEDDALQGFRKFSLPFPVNDSRLVLARVSR